MVDDHRAARLARARAFDRNALAAIYDDYHDPIYRYVYRQVGDVEVARDLTASVFRRFLQAIRDGGGPTQQAKAWLYRTAHNAVVDYYRRQQHRRHLPLREELVDADDDPARSAERNMAAADVRAALRQLTTDQRQVIVLKFLEGFSNEEVATVLEKTVGAVKSLQHRGLAALQRRLESEEKVPA